MNLGTKVVHAMHDKGDDGWRGIVTAKELYTDFAGTREWLYVRWISPTGAVPDTPTRHQPEELRSVEHGPA